MNGCLTTQSEFSMISWNQPHFFLGQTRHHSEDHKILESIIFTALPILCSFLFSVITTRTTFYHGSLSFPCCFALMWYCIWFVVDGILRVRFNHYYISIITERLLFFLCFFFIFFCSTYPVTCMIGKRIFQNLWLFNSHQNHVFPKT